MYNRVVINGKAGKAPALSKFLDMSTLSQSGRADYAQPLALPHLKYFVITPLVYLYFYQLTQVYSAPLRHKAIEN